MSLISLNNISKTYTIAKNYIRALDDICMDIDEGEYIAITGSSGSGKSTLMNIIGCLDTQTDGEYYLGGKNVRKLKERELSAIRSRTIGFVFQSFNLIHSLSALENVELILTYQGVKRNARRDMAMNALRLVGMDSRANHRPSQLSGGQQQRVAIARAIVQNPPIILADEPTGNLDTKTGGEIVEILDRLNNDGKTIILITHDNDVAKRARKTVRIKDGKILTQQ